MITWIRGNYHIRTARDTMVLREGLVTEDGRWGIVLDGEHLTLTHIASGKRVTRFKSLVAMDQLIQHLNSMAVGWTAPNPRLTEAQELEILAVLRSCLKEG